MLPVLSNQKKNRASKREKILLAAVEMFIEKDFYQVTVIEIAELAGVGKGTVYEYFPSKEVLFKECFAYCIDFYLGSFQKHLKEVIPVRKTMEDIVNSHLEMLQDNRKKIHLLFHERPYNFQELQSWIFERRQELLEGIKALIEKGIENGEIKPGIDVEMAGRLFLALNYVVMGGMIIIDNLEVNRDKVGRLLDIYWNGLAR